MTANRILSFTVRLPLVDSTTARVDVEAVKEAVRPVILDYFEASDGADSIEHFEHQQSNSCRQSTMETNDDDQEAVHAIEMSYPMLIVNDNVYMTDFVHSVERAIRSSNRVFAGKHAYTGEVSVTINRVALSDDTSLSSQLPVSFNNTQVLRDPLDFYLSFFSKEMFAENLTYIASAYVKHFRAVKDPNERHSMQGWRRIVSRFVDDSHQIDDVRVRDAYEKADNYAYSVITLHALVVGMGKHRKRQVTEYVNGLIAYHMRKAFNGEFDHMAQAFAIYVRNEVFFMEDKLIRYDGNLCYKASANVLAGDRKEAFFSFIENEFDAYLSRLHATKDSVDISKYMKNKIDSKKPFAIRGAAAFVEKLTETYLFTQHYVGLDSIATAYRDGVIIVTEEGGKKKLTVRHMLMEDQLFSTGNAYLFPEEKYSWQHPLVQGIDACFHHVFQAPELVKWFYRWMASLHFKDPERTLLFLYGEKGGNAKSVIMMALSRMMGKYAHAANDNLFHSDPASGHQSSMAELEGKNLVFMNEPNTSKEVPCNVLKVFASVGEPVTASKKGKDPRTFPLVAKAVILMNRFPKVNSPDPALYDRMRITECKGRYVHYEEGVTKLGPFELPRNDLFWAQPGIENCLLWMCRASEADYLEKRLAPTRQHLLALDAWHDGICSAKRFLVEHCHADKQISVMYDVEQVWDTYETWIAHVSSKDNKEIKKSREEFLRILRKEFGTEVKTVRYRHTADRNVAWAIVEREVVNIVMPTVGTKQPTDSRCLPVVEKASMPNPNRPAVGSEG